MPDLPLEKFYLPRWLVKLFNENRFFRFLVIGGINTVFGYSVYAFLVILGLHYAAAVAIATVAGVLFNFKTIGVLVFQKSENHRIFRFIGVYVALYGFNVLVIRIATSYGLEALLAGAIAILPGAVLSYIMNRVFVFGVTG